MLGLPIDCDTVEHCTIHGAKLIVTSNLSVPCIILYYLNYRFHIIQVLESADIIRIVSCNIASFSL